MSTFLTILHNKINFSNCHSLELNGKNLNCGYYQLRYIGWLLFSSLCVKWLSRIKALLWYLNHVHILQLKEHLSDLPSNYQQLFVSAVTVRRNDLRTALVDKVNSVSHSSLVDFDWKAKVCSNKYALFNVRCGFMHYLSNRLTAKGSKCVSDQITKTHTNLAFDCASPKWLVDSYITLGIPIIIDDSNIPASAIVSKLCKDHQDLLSPVIN